jgi:hypothetical protein
VPDSSNSKGVAQVQRLSGSAAQRLRGLSSHRRAWSGWHGSRSRARASRLDDSNENSDCPAAAVCPTARAEIAAARAIATRALATWGCCAASEPVTP